MHHIYFHILLYLVLTGPLTSERIGKSPFFAKGKICIGTNGRMSVPSNREHHYLNLRDRYTNCTYVDGNLELTWLQDENLDLSFLQEIREVTGYVLISHVDVKKIVLSKLMIIRGRTLFKINVRDEKFSLTVMLSKMENIEMPSLRDILAGNVGFFNNYNLCHIRTINWNEIITGPSSKYIYVYDFKQPERTCPECHKSCEAGCWSEGEHNCQQFSKINCSPQCHQGRCFGVYPRECCHLFCAGGCTGPTQRDCLACSNFYDDGVCKQECPPMMRYNPSTYSWETNPDGKYAYGATCVKNCPDHLLKDSGACVLSCPSNKKAEKGECVPCGGPCPKNCEGVEVVHAGNIDSFEDCTIIEGSLTILDHSFNSFQEIYPNFTFGPRYPKMDPEKLNVFNTLKEVTGYVNIQADFAGFENLSYFRNLEVIGGRQLTEYFSALYIVRSSLNSLNLNSLKSVNSGGIAILENHNLCFANSLNWRKIMKSSKHKIRLQNNAEDEACKQKNLICHRQCTEEGCWGPGPNECLSCKNYKLENICVVSCNTKEGIYDDGFKICKQCHKECLGICKGPGANNCSACQHVKDGPYCVDKCPESKYNDNGECEFCHENCVGGCTGPENTLGKNGCNSCEKALINSLDHHDVEQCLKGDASCPEGFYQEYIGPHEEKDLKNLIGKSVCRRCHPRCKNCSAFGIHISLCECIKYSTEEQCQDKCPRDHYPDDKLRKCLKCSEECRECYGPTTMECHICRNLRVNLDVNGTLFNCTSMCPEDKPHKVFSDDQEVPYCSDLNNDENTFQKAQAQTILFIILAAVILFFIFSSVFCYLCLKRMKTKQRKDKLRKNMIDLDEIEPLKPTNIQPNLAKLMIIKEAEIKKGGILGYGAFGTVYKGVWSPEKENMSFPVAIKVVREGTSPNTSNEFLEEAYIMASVDHPNLLKLLAVCMASQIMLVTQLMPLGCLLDYVRVNRDRIGSKHFLNWCAQIAKGMAYLEEKRMVHRDLALRNVLLQTPGFVKITDFGLAKLLDYEEDEYKASGGKMPIKWLALECIQHRVFTHKSDVWAFGVTIWELLSYGERPYEHLNARDVPYHLEKGERLSQPAICTIEVFMIMIKCWLLNAESRPSFKSLVEDFTKMSQDPCRFLVIKGDESRTLPIYTLDDEKEFIYKLYTSLDTESKEVLDEDDYLKPRYVSTLTGVERSEVATKKMQTKNEEETDPKESSTLLGHSNSNNQDTSHQDPLLKRKSSSSNDLDPENYLVPIMNDPGDMANYMEIVVSPDKEHESLSVSKSDESLKALDNPQYLSMRKNEQSNNSNLVTNDQPPFFPFESQV